MIDYKVDASGWFTEIEGVTVIKEPLLTTSGSLGAETVLVWHTTETEGPVGTYPHPPHGEIHKKQLRQFVPLTQRAEALVGLVGGGPYSPNLYAVQFEIVGNSVRTPWKPDEDTTDTLARVSAAVCDFHAIPRVVPNDSWRDDCQDIPTFPTLAIENSRRLWAKEVASGELRNYPAKRGIWNHMEVPWQGNVVDPSKASWHWDCGAMRRTKIIEQLEGYMGLTEADKKVIANWLGVSERVLQFIGDPALTIKEIAVDDRKDVPTEADKAKVFNYFRSQEARIEALEATIASMKALASGTPTPDRASRSGPDTPTP
jgi:hypothetical protein